MFGGFKIIFLSLHRQTISAADDVANIGGILFLPA
jgi:hypothetical protein